jgi:hypothetical protein
MMRGERTVAAPPAGGLQHLQPSLLRRAARHDGLAQQAKEDVAGLKTSRRTLAEGIKEIRLVYGVAQHKRKAGRHVQSRPAAGGAGGATEGGA